MLTNATRKAFASWSNMIHRLYPYMQNVYKNRRNLRIRYSDCILERGTNILFVIDELGVEGGIETRLLQYCDALAKDGYNIHILTKFNLKVGLLKFNNYYLDIWGDNYYECLLRLVKCNKISVIEFHSVPDVALSKIKFSHLQAFCKVGFVIHGTYVSSKFLMSKNFNYLIGISKLLELKFLNLVDQKVHILPNSIEYESCVYRHSNQSKAILITRIDDEKLGTIESFIEFCIKVEIDFHIAGSEVGSKKITNYILEKYKIDPNVFLGCVETLHFLKSNTNEYLFVAGVGQVVIEAGVLGFPLFLTSHLGCHASTFLTKGNVQSIAENNFTIKRLDKKIEVNQVVDFSRIKNGEIGSYCLHDFFINHYNFKSVYTHYKEIINS